MTLAATQANVKFAPLQVTSCHEIIGSAATKTEESLKSRPLSQHPTAPTHEPPPPRSNHRSLFHKTQTLPNTLLRLQELASQHLVIFLCSFACSISWYPENPVALPTSPPHHHPTIEHPRSICCPGSHQLPSRRKPKARAFSSITGSSSSPFRLSAVAGTAEPIYGPEAIYPVSLQEKENPKYETDSDDLKWLALEETSVETQTFYIEGNSGHFVIAQAVYSNVM